MEVVLQFRFHPNIKGLFRFSTNAATCMVLMFSVNVAEARFESEMSDFSRAMYLYLHGKKEAAYPVLEKVYSDEKSPQEKKFRVAMILAFAPNSQLNKGKRHQYATFCLQSDGGLTGKSRPAILRIAGDGYFDAQNFQKATEYYLALGADQDLRNRAYSEYRLGWIELNLQQADVAFTRWVKFLRKYGTDLSLQDKDLTKSIVRDIGRSWAESIEAQSHSTSFGEELSTLELLSSFESDLIEGIILGLKRYSNVDWIESFRQQLFRTRYAQLVFNGLLQKDVVFKAFPCELKSWLVEPIQVLASQEAQLFNYLNQCAKWVVEKQACEKPEGLGVRTLFETIQLKESQLLPRISLSVSCKQWHLACRDLIYLAAQSADSQGKGPSDETTRALFETCSHAFVDPKTAIKVSNSESSSSVLAQVQMNLPSLLEKYLGKKLLLSSQDPKLAQDPIYSLTLLSLQDPTLRSSLLQILLKVSPSEQDLIQILENTFLPDSIVDSLTDQDLLEYGGRLLPVFGKVPLNSTWMRVLDALVRKNIEEKNFSETQGLLDRYVPMSESVAKDETQSGLWELYWLGIDEKAREIQTTNFSLWMKALPYSRLSTERKLRAFGLALQFENLEQIWVNWSHFSKVVRTKTDLLAGFYAKTQEMVLSKTLSPDLLNSTIEGKILVRLSESDPTLTSKQVKAVLQAGVPLSGDLEGLDQLRATSVNLKRGKLKFNGLFAQNLGRKLKLIQKEEKLLAETTWTNPQFAFQAKGILISDCKSLVSELESIRKLMATTPELASVVEQLGEIIQQMNEKVSQLSLNSEGSKTSE